MNRKQEQGELIFMLGQFFGPLLRIAANPEGFESVEKVKALARFFAEYPAILSALERFSTGEPGHNYLHQKTLSQMPIYGLLSPGDFGPNSEQLIHTVSGASKRVLEAVLSIPIPLDSTIHEARTPFTTYCLLKNLCSTSVKKIVWTDRYFSPSLFHRHLSEVPPSTEITLITWPRSKCGSKKDETRYDQFLDVSRLFALERGPVTYSLITYEDIHDRWLLCDDNLFQLGGSVKDIGKETTFTVSRLDSTPDNLSKVEKLISGGTEVFGKVQTVHP
jgi:hypothetical protein